MKYSLTSTGDKVSDATIKANRSKTYRSIYTGSERCAGCNGRAQGTAHIIPQQECKIIGKAELCWLAINMVPACYHCNSVIESYKSKEFGELNCFETIMDVTKKFHPQRYQSILNYHDHGRAKENLSRPNDGRED
jgi:hypothetical protein